MEVWGPFGSLSFRRQGSWLSGVLPALGQGEGQGSGKAQTGPSLQWQHLEEVLNWQRQSQAQLPKLLGLVIKHDQVPVGWGALEDLKKN